MSAQMKSYLQTLQEITADAADTVTYDTTGSGTVQQADPDVIAFLAEDPVYSEAVMQAHDKAGDGEWVIVGLDLPENIALEMQDSFRLALKESRAARDETAHYRWDVKLTPGLTRGTSRIRFKCNLWTDAQLRKEAVRLDNMRAGRHKTALSARKAPARKAPSRTRR